MQATRDWLRQQARVGTSRLLAVCFGEGPETADAFKAMIAATSGLGFLRALAEQAMDRAAEALPGGLWILCDEAEGFDDSPSHVLVVLYWHDGQGGLVTTTADPTKAEADMIALDRRVAERLLEALGAALGSST